MFVNALKRNLFKRSFPTFNFGGMGAVTGRLMAKDQIIWLNVRDVNGDLMKVA